MSETPTEQAPVEVPVAAESASTEVSAPPVPEKKKRGRKPKVPTPPPAAVAAPKPPRKRRTAIAKASKGERAVAAAVSAAQVDRVKCIEELTKVMQAQYSKEGVLKALDWKIGMLTGNTAAANVPAMPSYPPPQYPQPPAYPSPSALAFVPPSMRTPAIPAVPQAGGGAIEGIVETQTDEEDQFLKGGIVGERGWV